MIKNIIKFIFILVVNFSFVFAGGNNPGSCENTNKNPKIDINQLWKNGTNGSNNYIELINSSGADVDVSDLEIYYMDENNLTLTSLSLSGMMSNKTFLIFTETMFGKEFAKVDGEIMLKDKNTGKVIHYLRYWHNTESNESDWYWDKSSILGCTTNVQQNTLNNYGLCSYPDASFGEHNINNVENGDNCNANINNCWLTSFNTSPCVDSKGSWNSNTPPIVNTNFIVVDENTTITLTTQELNTTDSEQFATELTYTITSIPSNGTIYKDATILGLNDTFTQDDVDNAKVSYNHNGSETFSDSFNFSVSDGVNSSTGKMDFTIQPVNDAPFLSPVILSLSVNETVTIINLNLPATDAEERPGELIYTLTSLANNGDIKLNNSVIGISSTFTQDDIDNAKVEFSSNGLSNDSNFTFNLFDGVNTISSQLDIKINSIPQILYNALMINQNDRVTITNTDLGATDVEESPTQLIYSLLTFPTKGNILLDTVAITSSNQNFTQKDIDDGKLEYMHTYSNDDNDTFNFSVTDGYASVTADMNITINSSTSSIQSGFKDFQIAYNNNIYGNIKLIGNSVLCENTGSGCVPNSNYANNNVRTRHIDIDGDSSTINSSSADLILPINTDVKFAILNWQGRTDNINNCVRDCISYYNGGSCKTWSSCKIDSMNKIKIKTPSSSTYTEIDALNGGECYYTGNSYQCYKNITSLVQGDSNGTYIVADLFAKAAQTNYYGAWALTVVYEDLNDAYKNISVYEGYKNVYNTTISVNISGFLTPASGNVNSELFAFSGEGDRPYKNDRILLKNSSNQFINLATGTTSTSSSDNIFDSSINTSTARDPFLINNMGIDIDSFNVGSTGLNIIGNSQTSTVIKFNSNGDQYYPGMVAFATDLYSPKVCYLENIYKDNKIVDENTSIFLGDLLAFEVNVSNIGTEPAAKVQIEKSFSAPIGYNQNFGTYINGTKKTNVTGDDEVEYVSSLYTLNSRIGTGADATNGGQIAVNDDYSYTYNADIIAYPINGEINNTYIVNYRSDTLNLNFNNIVPKCYDTSGFNSTTIFISKFKIDLDSKNRNDNDDISVGYNEDIVIDINLTNLSSFDEIEPYFTMNFVNGFTLKNWDSNDNWTCGPINLTSVSNNIICNLTGNINKDGNYSNISINLLSHSKDEIFYSIAIAKSSQDSKTISRSEIQKIIVKDVPTLIFNTSFPEKINIEDDFNYTVEIDNVGSAEALNLEANLTINSLLLNNPSFGDIINVNDTNWSCIYKGNNLLNCKDGNLTANDANRTINIPLTAKEAGTYTASMYVDANNSSSVSKNDTLKIIGTSTLSIDVETPVNELYNDIPFDLNITVTNTGEVAENIELNLTIEDLPLFKIDGNTLSNGTIAYLDVNWTCTYYNNNILNCKDGNLNDGESIKLKLLFTTPVNKVGYFEVNASVVSDLNSTPAEDNNRQINVGYPNLDVTLNTSFLPSQVFPNEDSTLSVTVKNISLFDAKDLNLTLSFYTLNSDFGISDVNSTFKNGLSSITTPSGWTYKSYVNNNDKTIIYFESNSDLAPNTSVEFTIDIQAPNKGGDLRVDSIINSVMMDTPINKTTTLSIVDLKAEYRFDECYLGSRGDGTSMNLIDQTRVYDGVSYDVNTTDKETKVSRVGDFSKDSATDYISLNKNVINNLSSLSISFWIKTDSTNQQTILSGANASDSNELSIIIDINGELKITTSEETITFSTTLNDNNWHHVIWVRSKTLNRIYVNELQFANQATSHNYQINISSGGFILGQNQGSVGGGFNSNKDFEGYIDEMKIFQTVLKKDVAQRVYTENNTRVAQNAYPKKYDFISDGKGIAGDKNGEEIKINALNTDGSAFEFIAPNDSRINYDTIYPTLKYFDLNISDSAFDTNISFEGNNYYLTSEIRFDEVNESFTYHNPCKDINGTSGKICTNSSDVTFNINSIAQYPVSGSYSVNNNGLIDYTLIDRNYYIKYKDDTTYITSGSYSFGGDSYKLMDALKKDYNFYMEFNESESGEELILTQGITDSVTHQDIVKYGFSTTLDNLIDSNNNGKNIIFTTPNDRLGLSTAIIKVENSENFCADGTYEFQVLTKPDSFKLELDSNELYLKENYQFLTEIELKYDENLTLNIIPICDSNMCSNSLTNLNNFLGNDKTTYFTKISSTFDIDINQTLNNPSTYHSTKWNSEGNFTKLYFKDNSLSSAIYNDKDNNKSVDLNFTVSYFGLYDKNGAYSFSSFINDNAIYGGGIPAKFIKGPDHLIASLDCQNKCGSECKITISPQDENNNTVEWSEHNVELIYTIKSGTINILKSVIDPVGSDDIIFNLNTETPTCCISSDIDITDILLIDPDGITTVNSFSSSDNKVYLNVLNNERISKNISFACPSYSFGVFDRNVVNEDNISNISDFRNANTNLVTKISNGSYDFTLVSYWDDNGTLTDFNVELISYVIDKLDSDSVVFTTDPNNLNIGVALGMDGVGSWNDVDTNIGTNAYRKLQIRVIEELNTSHSDTSDFFAIRPANFDIDIIPSNNPNTNTARAGENFIMDLKVQDSSNNNILNYNERENQNRSFTIDSNLTHNGFFNQIDLNLNDDFNYTNEGSLSFISGVNNSFSSILEVGIFDINITDGNGSYEGNPNNCSSCNSNTCVETNGCPYACIDIIDNSCSGLSVIDYAKDTITIYPYDLNISTDFIYPFNDQNWTYMAELDDDINIRFDFNITAKNMQGVTVKNFDNDIFYRSVKIPLQFTQQGLVTNFIYHTILNSSEINDLSSSDEIAFENIFFADLPNNDFNFSSGESNNSIIFNVKKYFDTPANPVNLKVENVTLNLESDMVTAGTTYNSTNPSIIFTFIENNASFYYGRIWADNYETLGDNEDIEIRVEVYCNNCEIDFTKDFSELIEKSLLAGDNENKNDFYWYRNIEDSFTEIANIKSIYTNIVSDLEETYPTSGINPKLNIIITNALLATQITRENTKYGIAKFNINTKEYLWFNKGYSYPVKPEFKVNFKSNDYKNPITKRRIDW